MIDTVFFSYCSNFWSWFYIIESIWFL